MNKTSRGAVIAAILAGDKILLIRQPDRHNPRWKFPGGEIEAGEDVMVAFAREIGDETKLPIKIHRGVDNRWVLSDNGIRLVHESKRSRPNRDGDGEHVQYFFVLEVQNQLDLLARGNDRFREDDDETIETGVFDLLSVSAMPDFLSCQLPLLQQVLHCRQAT